MESGTFMCLMMLQRPCHGSGLHQALHYSFTSLNSYRYLLFCVLLPVYTTYTELTHSLTTQWVCHAC